MITIQYDSDTGELHLRTPEDSLTLRMSPRELPRKVKPPITVSAYVDRITGHHGIAIRARDGDPVKPTWLTHPEITSAVAEALADFLQREIDYGILHW